MFSGFAFLTLIVTLSSGTLWEYPPFTPAKVKSGGETSLDENLAVVGLIGEGPGGIFIDDTVVVALGFDTLFTWENPSSQATQTAGITFLLQTDGASSIGGGNMGIDDTFGKFVAVKFSAAKNVSDGDPATCGSYVSVQREGSAGLTVPSIHPTACLDGASHPTATPTGTVRAPIKDIDLTQDSGVYTGRVVYDPVEATLTVYVVPGAVDELDDDPVLSAQMDLEVALDLISENDGERGSIAYVGLTGGSLTEIQVGVTSWVFDSDAEGGASSGNDSGGFEWPLSPTVTAAAGGGLCVVLLLGLVLSRRGGGKPSGSKPQNAEKRRSSGSDADGGAASGEKRKSTAATGSGNQDTGKNRNSSGGAAEEEDTGPTAAAAARIEARKSKRQSMGSGTRGRPSTGSKGGRAPRTSAGKVAAGLEPKKSAPKEEDDKKPEVLMEKRKSAAAEIDDNASTPSFMVNNNAAMFLQARDNADDEHKILPASMAQGDGPPPSTSGGAAAVAARAPSPVRKKSRGASQTRSRGASQTRKGSRGTSATRGRSNSNTSKGSRGTKTKRTRTGSTASLANKLDKSKGVKKQ